MSKLVDPTEYEHFLNEIKEQIQRRQLEAFRKVNQILLSFYWEIGKSIAEKQKEFDWGKSVIKTLSQDLRKIFPGIRGFSVQNLWNMRNPLP